jgi:hypothetical protein
MGWLLPARRQWWQHMVGAVVVECIWTANAQVRQLLKYFLPHVLLYCVQGEQPLVYSFVTSLCNDVHSAPCTLCHRSDGCDCRIRYMQPLNELGPCMRYTYVVQGVNASQEKSIDFTVQVPWLHCLTHHS